MFVQHLICQYLYVNQRITRRIFNGADSSMNQILNSNRPNPPLLRGEICPAKYEQLTNRGVLFLRGPARPSHSGGEICPARYEQQTNRGVLLLRGPARPSHSGGEICPAKYEQACTERSEVRYEQMTNRGVLSCPHWWMRFYL